MAKTPEGLLCQLWIALDACGDNLSDEEACIRRADFDGVREIERSLDWGQAVVFSSIKSLRAMIAENDLAPPAAAGADEWSEALDAYNQLRAASDLLPPEDPRADEAVDAYVAAMDHLVENVRAPSPEALAVKLELARDRWNGFSIPDEWLDAFAADLKHFGGEA